MHGENKDIHPDRSEVSELKRHLRRVEALAEIGSWKFDLDTRKVYTSEKTREIYGLEGAEWSIEQVQKVPLPEYRQMLDDALRDLVKNNTPYDVEFEIKRPADGAIRHIHSVAEYDAEHNLIIGTLQDRTEHWHARNEIERHIEQLQESESYQRAIIQTTSDGFWMLDNKGTILDVNEAYCKMSGYTRDELTGRNISDVDRDESAEDTAEHIKKIITEGTDTFEAWHCRKDGTWWPLEVSSTHFDNGGGRFVCFGRDLTQRKIRENTLRESQQRLQMAVEGANIGLWDWHVEAEHVSFSETWAEMFGYKKDELESRVDYFLEHVHPDDRSLVKQRLQEHLDGKIDYYESEHRMRTKSDDYIWTLDRGKVVERNESGEPIRVIGLITNINKVKTVEESLRESEKNGKTSWCKHRKSE